MADIDEQSCDLALSSILEGVDDLANLHPLEQWRLAQSLMQRVVVGDTLVELHLYLPGGQPPPGGPGGGCSYNSQVMCGC